MSTHVVSAAEMSRLLVRWGFERVPAGCAVGGHAIYRHIDSGRRLHIRLPSGKNSIPPWTVKRAATMVGADVPTFLDGPDTEVRTRASALPVVGRDLSKLSLVAVLSDTRQEPQ